MCHDRIAASVVANEMIPSRYRVLAVCSHPVQYAAPIFRRMAKHTELDLQVAFCSMSGAEAASDPDFGVTVQWDVPLLSGYSWTQLADRGSGSQSLWGLWNPALRSLIMKGSFDAVLCFVGYVSGPFWIAYHAARASGAAFLFGTDAVSLVPRDRTKWKVAVKRLLWPRLFSLADQVIVPSSGTHDLMRALGVPEEQITLTPYSVDNDWWIAQSAKVDRAGVRASWGTSSTDAVILFCAKLQPWKRPMDVLQAFAKARLDNAVLVFAGEGQLRSQLERASWVLGVRDRVRFLGFVNQSELPSVYTASDLMVLPSEYEPFGVVVNEAMCCSCPVMASDCVGAARDLIVPVHADFVFPVGDIECLAKSLRQSLQEREKLRQIGEAFFRHVQTWSPERNISATIEAISRAVSRVRARHRAGSGSLHEVP